MTSDYNIAICKVSTLPRSKSKTGMGCSRLPSTNKWADEEHDQSSYPWPKNVTAPSDIVLPLYFVLSNALLELDGGYL